MTTSLNSNTSQMESTLPRRERERLMRRQAMLEAARAIFAEKGFAQATIEEVAHRAEFGKGTVYNYFENKEQLLVAILDEMFDEICTLIENAFAEPPADREAFRTTLQRFLQRLLVFFRERQDLFMILMKEAQSMLFSEEREKAAYLMHQNNRVVNALVLPIRQAIEAGHLKALPAEMIAHTILGNVKGFQMHMCVASRHEEKVDAPLTPEIAAAFLSTMLLDGLLAEPEPQPYN